MKVGVCNFDNNKKEELKRYSIYILDNDTDTDFDFYVLVDSEEARKKNEFLMELFNFLDNGNNSEFKNFVNLNHKKELKDWLGIKDDNDPNLTVLNWLKIAIEKYPYRLFVAVDDDKVNMNKEEAKKKLEFLKKRICWIRKNEYETAFSEGNQDILKITPVKDDGKEKNSNILAERDKNGNEKFKWQERAKLWLYYKWVEHLYKNVKGYNGEIALCIHTGSSSSEQYFYSLTLPEKNFSNSFTVEKYSIYKDNCIKIHCKMGIDVENNMKIISYSRHGEGPIARAENELKTHYNNWLYHSYLSGAMYSFPLFSQFNRYYFPLLLVENGLLNIGIIDERFIKWFRRLNPLEFWRVLHRRIFPIENIQKWEGYSDFKDITFHPENGVLQVNHDFLKNMTNSLPDVVGTAYLKNFKNYINSSNPLEKVTLDMILIHQGIIDKIKISHSSLLKIKDKVPFLLITSGRGKPEDIPKGEKFLPFSTFDFIMKPYQDDILFRKILMKISETGG